MARHIIEKNQFYSLTPFAARESILSISSWDYSVGFVTLREIREILAQHAKESIVLNSSIFNEDSLEDIKTLILAYKSNVRIQISSGAEYDRYLSVVQQWLQLGIGIDFLIDRPINEDLRQKLEEIRKYSDVRLCVVANKYFPFYNTLQSIPVTWSDRVRLLFLSPSAKDSCYLSADEVVASLAESQQLESFKILVFENIIKSHPLIRDKEFFLNLDCEKYFSQKNWMDTNRQLRKTLDWMLKRRAIALMDLLYFGLVFLKKPSLGSLLNTLGILVNIGSTLWAKLYIVVRYRLFPRLKALAIFVSFPVFKIYWFFEFQIENRILPLFNKGSE